MVVNEDILDSFGDGMREDDDFSASIDKQQVDFSFEIPEPTQSDLKWAKKLKSADAETLEIEVKTAVACDRVWRLNYLFSYRPKTVFGKEKPAPPVTSNSAYIREGFSCALARGHVGTLKYYIKYAPDYVRDMGKYILTKALTSRNQEAVDLIQASGACQTISLKDFIANEERLTKEQWEFAFKNNQKWTNDDVKECITGLLRKGSSAINIECLEQHIGPEFKDLYKALFFDGLYESKKQVCEYLCNNGVEFDEETHAILLQKSVELGKSLWKVECCLKAGAKATDELKNLAERQGHQDVLLLLNQYSKKQKAKTQLIEYPKWEKIDDYSVSYISLAGGKTLSKINTVFNFKSRRIAEFLQDDAGRMTPMDARNFSEYEERTMIDTAEKELKALGGTPKPYVCLDRPINKERLVQHKKPVNQS